MSKQKKTKHYSVKSLPLEIKDFDAGSRLVSGYLSSFGVKDSDSDIIIRGAFAKSLREKGVNSQTNRKIAFLRNHNWDLPIGKFIELQEDDYGLKFTAQLSEASFGNDAFIQYQEGIIREHSIGFKYVSDGIEYSDEEDAYIIKEVNLFEGSAVTFGANEHTPVIEVAPKTEAAKEKLLSDLRKQQNQILKTLKQGKNSDETLLSLEMKQRQLVDVYESLINHRPLKEALKDDRPIIVNAVDFLKNV